MTIFQLLKSSIVGGAELHALVLTQGLVARGHRVIVMCPEGPLCAPFRAAGAEVVIDSPVFDIDPWFIGRVFALLRREEVTVFHAHELKPVINGLLASFAARVPVRIAHIHSPLIYWQIPWYKKIPNILVNALVSNICASKVIALMPAIRTQRLWGELILPFKIEVVPNGVNFNEFEKAPRAGVPALRRRLGFSKEHRVVGTLSRLTEEKGLEVFLTAIHLLRKMKKIPPHVHFAVAGDGELRGSLEQYVKEKKLKNVVTFAGFLSDSEREAYYHLLSLFVFPTLHEGFGYVLAEAMAAGTPTLSSDLAVLRDLTGQGVYGYHFQTGNAEDCARQLEVLLTNEDHLRALSPHAQEHIRMQYTNEQFIERYEQLYLRLAGIHA